VLLLEYEEDYLWAWLQDVDFELGNPWTHLEKLCKGCGDRFRQVSLMSFWRVKREELTQ
jgi:hypothetical protein